MLDGGLDGFASVKYRYDIAASVMYRWTGLRATTLTFDASKMVDVNDK
jgi:hypothetical protein